MIRTIAEKENNPEIIEIIDQRLLPFELKVAELTNYKEAVFAIKEMLVRGAPLIGVTAAYGMWLASLEAMRSGNFDKFINKAAFELTASRPTAVNLHWAVKKALLVIQCKSSTSEKAAALLKNARETAADDIEQCRQIGIHGLEIISQISASKNGGAVNILTHCNAGRLAAIEWGTATAPIYAAFHNGIDIHVWVDETRPRNQGARLTCWELGEAGVKHTLVADNVGGHLMQQGLVDLAIVGSDRTSSAGDVANKIGTYLKALAANDNGIPFYAALPSSTIDWDIENGIAEIPIEERNSEETLYVEGLHQGNHIKALIAPENTHAANYAFDVTPARLITGIITERGVCKANKQNLRELFPEYSNI